MSYLPPARLTVPIFSVLASAACSEHGLVTSVHCRGVAEPSGAANCVVAARARSAPAPTTVHAISRAVPAASRRERMRCRMRPGPGSDNRCATLNFCGRAPEPVRESAQRRQDQPRWQPGGRARYADEPLTVLDRFPAASGERCTVTA